MLRLGTPADTVARWRRRAILRFGFLGALGLAATEIGALVAPFIRVRTGSKGSETRSPLEPRLRSWSSSRQRTIDPSSSARVASSYSTRRAASSPRTGNAPISDAPSPGATPRTGSIAPATDRSTTNAPRSCSGFRHPSRCSSFTSPKIPRVSWSSIQIHFESSTEPASGTRR